MNPPVLTEMDMVIRLGIGFLAGAVIGVERSTKHQVAGLRTHIIICVGATLLMLLSIWLPQEYNSLKNGDPGRIAAQVVSGIGFLGAGAIIRLGNNVRGLTTAGSLWFIAAVGLAVGAGMFLAAAVAEVLALAALWLLGLLEKRFFPADRTKLLELSYTDNNPDTRSALEIMSTYGVRVMSMDVNQGSKKDKGTKMRVLAGIPNTTDIAKLAKALKATGEVARIDIKEKY